MILPSRVAGPGDALITLTIGAADLALIEAEVRRAFPREACGLLIGDEEGDVLRVGRVSPAENVAGGGGYDRFEIDPMLLARTHRSLRGGSSRIIGHYHSHPHGIAAPSAADRNAAYTPGLAWLILGFAGEGAVTGAAFLHPPNAPPPLADFQAIALAVRPDR